MPHLAPDERPHPHTIRTSVFTVGGGGGYPGGGPQNPLGKHAHYAVYLIGGLHW